MNRLQILVIAFVESVPTFMEMGFVVIMVDFPRPDYH